MMERGISRRQVKKGLDGKGEVIDSYQDDRPYPSLLLDGRPGQETLRVVAAFDQAEGCSVITAYRPDREHFESDLKTRGE